MCVKALNVARQFKPAPIRAASQEKVNVLEVPLVVIVGAGEFFQRKLEFGHATNLTDEIVTESEGAKLVIVKANVINLP